MSAPPVISLLTDFGLSDHYVSDVKGVLLSILPEAQIVDITHNIPPQNIRAAAYQLLASYRHQPAGALFLCVVDPGVGSGRKIIYAEAGGWRFIAPDNGLLSWVLDTVKPQLLLQLNDSLPVKQPVSSTFHGRDVMAPVGARILAGKNPSEFGVPVNSYMKLPFPIVLKHGSMWQGEVLAVDGFGSLITNFRSSEVSPLASTSKMWVEFDKTSATIRGLSGAYASVEPGQPLALEGSGGFIEISVNQGSAASRLNLSIGDRVSIHFRA